jgi:hypothetical protein
MPMDTDIRLERINPRAGTLFRVNLGNTEDLQNLHAVIHELYPDRLSSFMRDLCPRHTKHRYGIDAIKYVFSQTPDNVGEYQLLGDILRITFHHARRLMQLAWDETIAAFTTTDLKQLTGLLSALDACDEQAKGRTINADDLFSHLHLRALSIDALASLLRQEEDGTPRHALRSEILDVARRLARAIEPGLCVDRVENIELYLRSDLRGNTIAHYIANGTLFPGAEQITFDFDDDTDIEILFLKNFAGQTVGDVYSARLAREEMMPRPTVLQSIEL